MWISVRDRLPKENGYYLVFDGEDQMICWFQYRDFGLTKNVEPFRFYDENNKVVDATHWQPLPENPSVIARRAA